MQTGSCAAVWGSAAGRYECVTVCSGLPVASKIAPDRPAPLPSGGAAGGGLHRQYIAADSLRFSAAPCKEETHERRSSARDQRAPAGTRRERAIGERSRCLGGPPEPHVVSPGVELPLEADRDLIGGSSGCGVQQEVIGAGSVCTASCPPWAPSAAEILPRNSSCGMGGVGGARQGVGAWVRRPRSALVTGGLRGRTRVLAIPRSDRRAPTPRNRTQPGAAERSTGCNVDHQAAVGGGGGRSAVRPARTGGCWMPEPGGGLTSAVVVYICVRVWVGWLGGWVRALPGVAGVYRSAPEAGLGGRVGGLVPLPGVGV